MRPMKPKPEGTRRGQLAVILIRTPIIGVRTGELGLLRDLAIVFFFAYETSCAPRRRAVRARRHLASTPGVQLHSEVGGRDMAWEAINKMRVPLWITVDVNDMVHPMWTIAFAEFLETVARPSSSKLQYYRRFNDRISRLSILSSRCDILRTILTN